jgi:hypothetical protein
MHRLPPAQYSFPGSLYPGVNAHKSGFAVQDVPIAHRKRRDENNSALLAR